MQKVRYCLSSNSFNIKFQGLFNPPLGVGLVIILFTVCSHYYSLSILDLLTLEIDFPLFCRRIPFYGILRLVPKRIGLMLKAAKGCNLYVYGVYCWELKQI